MNVCQSDLWSTLPPPWPVDLRPQIHESLSSQPGHKLVVLDDDPTGTQTVYDLPVLTEWSVESLRAEFAGPLPCFYLLTNSRSLTPAAAEGLNREIARNLRAAAGRRSFTLVSRSDSTLRGHYPLETDTLTEELGPFDATILIPYFEAGGRYTIDAVHYVADGDQLIPAAETPFAQDAVFGYRHSNLRDWVEEKTHGRTPASDVVSISLRSMRSEGPAGVTQQLTALPRDAVCVVDAADPRDLDVFVAGLLAAERAGRRFLFRTAAQFVAARLGLSRRPLLTAAELNLPSREGPGGLIVVGSYVPNTTQQLQSLLQRSELCRIDLVVESLLDPAQAPSLLEAAAARMNSALESGRDVVVSTSRELVSAADPAANLAIGQQVSEALVNVVQRLAVRPRFLVAKGGITSSDVATHGLGVRRAMVAGQLLPGVPVWQLGAETTWPGLLYVVFPGNVGGPDALMRACDHFSS